MVSLTALALPIFVAAVFVFLASFLVHMVIGYHNSDYRSLPNETETLAALRKANLTPGLYTFPHCTNPKEMGTPEMAAKYQQGPIGMMTVMPNGMPAMGKSMAAWFGYCLLVGLFCAYLAGHTLTPGAHYLAVFRIVGSVAFVGYGLGNILDSIWKGWPWSASIKHVLDGLLYALLTAGTFGWLWPS